MRNFLSLFLLLFSASVPSCCQGLESIPAVLISGPGRDKISKDVSFILTPNMKMEIVDADMPWPPRWFAPGKEYKKGALNKDSVIVTYIDARFQNGEYTVCKKTWGAKAPTVNDINQQVYLICNNKMEPVDTFKGIDLPVNSHDFKISTKGEELTLARLDTFLDLHGVTGHPADTHIKSMIDIIEIVDAHNNIVFRWNPVSTLGVNSLYHPYGGLISPSAKIGFVDWSHGNAVNWDFDGNILYCFRHIGVGKISRADGHVIWRIDRNQMPYVHGTDSLAFYLQHGFERVREEADKNIYSLYCNGDSAHHSSYGIQFSVDMGTNAFHVVKKLMPPDETFAMQSGGYEIYDDGNYILNLGSQTFTFNKKDTAKYKISFEYGNDSSNEVYAYYSLPKSIHSYKIHELKDCKLPRPAVSRNGKTLSATGDMQSWTWYQLSGPGNSHVNKVGEGEKFNPRETGIYCVAGKYGIGYAVSLPFDFKL